MSNLERLVDRLRPHVRARWTLSRTQTGERKLLASLHEQTRRRRWLVVGALLSALLAGYAAWRHREQRQ